MITVRLDGGLGNQLFQFAFLMYVSKISGIPYFVESLDSPSTCHSRECYFESIFKQWKCYYENKCITSTIHENPHFKVPNLENEIIRFTGYFQKWQYVEPIKEEFIAKLSFDETILEKYPDISKKFFVHVRGGDYVNHYFHDVGLKNYYAKCLEICKGEEFIIFTNDVDYANRIMPECEIVQESEVDTLLLMSKCKGCICANSSFSWWGAYLNPKRPIYFPNKWFNDPNMEILGYYFDGCQIVDLN
jgi:hypothetical protein